MRRWTTPPGLASIPALHIEPPPPTALPTAPPLSRPPLFPHRAAADNPLQRNDGGGAGVACSWPIGRSIQPALSRVCNAIRPPRRTSPEPPRIPGPPLSSLSNPPTDTQRCATQHSGKRTTAHVSICRPPPTSAAGLDCVGAGGATFHIALLSCADRPSYSEIAYCLRCCADSCCPLLLAAAVVAVGGSCSGGEPDSLALLARHLLAHSLHHSFCSPLPSI